jgi:hypothetical protein
MSHENAILFPAITIMAVKWLQHFVFGVLASEPPPEYQILTDD